MAKKASRTMKEIDKKRMIKKIDKMSEKEVEDLLSRVAKLVGLDLLVLPEETWIEKRWCFAKGFARFTINYYSPRKMLKMLHRYRDFILVPGTWNPAIGERYLVPNPFYGCSSLEEIQVKLDLELEEDAIELQRRKAEQMASRSEAVCKMLEVLSLRIVRRRFDRKMPGVLDKENGIVRSFKIVESGKTLVWINDNPARPHLGLSGNGILGGSWTVFKDTDDATFSLFTEKIKCFFTYGQRNPPVPRVFYQNPFYGCKSVEEVLVKCDLLGRCN